MKAKKPLFVLILSLLGICRLFGISFHGLDLSDDDRLLFGIDIESVNIKSMDSKLQHSLFISHLAKDLSLQQLTAFPEKLEIVNNGSAILVSSRFGAARIPASGGLPAPLPGVPSFTAGNVPLEGRLQEFAASADGRWVLHAEPISPAYGKLIIIETTSGAKRVVSEKIELPAADFPAQWNPDSRFFVYSKDSRLYYYPVFLDASSMPDERFRFIGSGDISSIMWGSRGDFYYLAGKTIYRIINTELFTRTIYGDFLSAGSVAGTIPLEFDSGLDRYWISPDSGSILLYKNRKCVFLFPLGKNNASAAVLPHIMLPEGAANLNVLWPSSGMLTVTFTQFFKPQQTERTVWRFDTKGNLIRNITTKEINASSAGILSPDETRAIFWGKNGLELWDYINWRFIQTLSRDPVYSCAWLNNEEIITGNARFIERINISAANSLRRRIICLSSAEEFGFEDSKNKRILARTGNEWFASDGKNSWVMETNPQLRKASLSSERYRVYLETRPSGIYKNMPMIRGSVTENNSTISVLSGHSASSAYTQSQGNSVALCFDLYDDDTGLSFVLDALNRFDKKATFFLNGDFIRRNPQAAAAIAEAGHEAASLFYAPIDLADSRYRVSNEFISQGLARNEDEFFKATGKELTLLWHPPFYHGSSAINGAASAAGYASVSPDIICGDSLSASDTIEQIIEQILTGKKSEVIISIQMGMQPGGRGDNAFRRIDVLLDALLRSGCRIVPASAIIGK